jgi:hypothetical protein
MLRYPHNTQLELTPLRYAALLADKRTQRVLSGESTMGVLTEYFVTPPAL